MDEYRTPDIEPLPEGMIPEEVVDDFRSGEPGMAAHCATPKIDEETMNVRVLMTLDVDDDEQFEEFIQTLVHELHHWILYEISEHKAYYDLDNIAGYGDYLVNCEYRLGE